MPEAALLLEPSPTPIDEGLMFARLDPLGMGRHARFVRPGARAWTSVRGGEPNDGIVFEEDELFAIAAGDIVNPDALEWRTMFNAFRKGEMTPAALSSLRGAYALLMLDTECQRLYAVTDPFAWQSLYISSHGDKTLFSTSLSACFGGALPQLRLSESWLYEFLFFNNGIGRSTPLSGASRLPAGCVARLDTRSGVLQEFRYHRPPDTPPARRGGKQAIAEAIEVFRDVAPRYMQANGRTVVSLSPGLDCRAALAGLPDQSLAGLHSFTYGIPGTSEITEAEELARLLGFQHCSFPLDEAFVAELPKLLLETVRLSDGLQNVNRAHLLHVYRQLHRDTGPYAALFTGVSGDHVFRDHVASRGNAPHIMSADMATMWREGRRRVDPATFRARVGERWPIFEAAIEDALDRIELEYGRIGDPCAYLSFLMYEAGPHYFGGQASIANRFVTFRTPYWDPDIVRLGYELDYGTLALASATASKDIFTETLLQASVVAANPSVRKAPYRRLPITAYSGNSRARYQLARAGRKIRGILSGRRFRRGEAWHQWYASPGVAAEIEGLLGDESRLRDYVTQELIDEARSQVDVHWLGKLITAELVLRLVEEGWQPMARAV